MLLKHRLSVCLILICINATAQELSVDPEVRTGKLNNGFTYYIRHNNEPRDRVIMYLVNKVGSLLEDDDQRGLAHFLEHMNFNGTRHYPKNQLIDYLEKAGVRFGADINAYTSFEETVYQLPLPSDDTAVVRNGLQIMRDWAADATLDREEIEKERGVILEEKRLRNGAQQRLMDKYFPLQVNGSRFAERLPIGTDEVIKNFKPEAIKRFYKNWYRPDLQALVVVGNISVDEMETKIKKLFGDLKNPVKQQIRKNYSIPLTGKNQFIALTDPEQPSTVLDVLIKQPALSYKTSEDYRNAIIRTILNGALAWRLQELSQKPDPPFVRVKSGLNSFMGGVSAFSINISSKPGKVRESFLAVWSVVEQYKRFGILSTELERQKILYQSHIERALKERDKRSSFAFMDEYVQHFLKGNAIPGMDEEHMLLKKHLESITTDDINKAIRSVIKEIDRDIIILAPEKENLPDESVVTNWIADVSGSALTAYTDKIRVDTLFPVLPAKGKIVSRKYLDSLGITLLKLSNGATVYVKPTDFRNDQILFFGLSEGGSSLYADRDFPSASTTASLVLMGGVRNFSRQELLKLLAGKGVYVQPVLGERHEGITGHAIPKNIETALQLLYLQLTEPRKDTAYIISLINQFKAGMANRSNDPAAFFADTVNAILSQNHCRRKSESVEMYDAIEIDKIYNIYQERFTTPGDFTYVFIGNIDTAKLFDLVEQYIGSLPSRGVDEKAKDIDIRLPQGKVRRTIYKGSENKATVRLVISGDYQFNDANNTQLNALRAILQFRITDRIRETEGGAYSPQAWVKYNKYPRSGYAFHVLFNCAPDNVEKLITATNEEIEKLKKEGPLQDDLKKFVAEEHRTTELNLRDNDFWFNYIYVALQNNEPLTSILYADQRLKDVTATSLRNAAATYLKGDNYITLVHLPEKKQ